MENKLEKIGQNSFMDNFVKTDDILNDMCGISESSQKAAHNEGKHQTVYDTEADKRRLWNIWHDNKQDIDFLKKIMYN